MVWLHTTTRKVNIPLHMTYFCPYTYTNCDTLRRFRSSVSLVLSMCWVRRCTESRSRAVLSFTRKMSDTCTHNNRQIARQSDKAQPLSSRPSHSTCCLSSFWRAYSNAFSALKRYILRQTQAFSVDGTEGHLSVSYRDFLHRFGLAQRGSHPYRKSKTVDDVTIPKWHWYSVLNQDPGFLKVAQSVSSPGRPLGDTGLDTRT